VSLNQVSPPKMLSGANAFEISEIQEDETEDRANLPIGM